LGGISVSGMTGAWAEAGRAGNEWWIGMADVWRAALCEHEMEIMAGGKESGFRGGWVRRGGR